MAISPIHFASAKLAEALDKLNVKYAIMGGAALFILGSTRVTHDIDLVVDVASGTANEDLNDQLKKLPGFTKVDVDKIENWVPAVVIAGGQPVPLELFDKWSWPDRPQYADVIKERVPKIVPDKSTTVSVFSPAWLLREKIASVQERQKNLVSQLQDIEYLCSIIPTNEHGQGLLDFRHQQVYADHLRAFLKRTDIPQDIRNKVAAICRILVLTKK